jgi:hypothetical protein
VGVPLPRNRARLVGVALAFVSLLGTGAARAQQPAPPPSADATIDIAPSPPTPTLGRPSEAAGPEGAAAGEIEAPPVRPRHKGIVLASNLGILGFTGQFRHVAPPAYWLDAQLGFEVLRWLMVFGEAELAFTDTSESQDESHTIAVPMWGFGGGARGRLHATERVAFFLQGEVGLLTSIVPRGALTVLGFRDAESPNPQFGTRIGVEWYQVNRHFALTANLGGRIAQGFSRVLPAGDTPLLWDTSVGVRYTF